MLARSLARSRTRVRKYPAVLLLPSWARPHMVRSFFRPECRHATTRPTDRPTDRPSVATRRNTRTGEKGARRPRPKVAVVFFAMGPFYLGDGACLSTTSRSAPRANLEALEGVVSRACPFSLLRADLLTARRCYPTDGRARTTAHGSAWTVPPLSGGTAGTRRLAQRQR
jgi:hypothetical protein